jgi:hypothetical protein
MKRNFVLLIITAVAGFFIWKFVKGSEKLTEYKLNQVPEDLNHYSRIAESLFNAMKGVGTKETEVLEQIKNLNGDELKAVYNAFGKRNYSLFGHDGMLTEWNILGVQLDLYGWFKKEFSRPELDKIRAVYLQNNVTVNF